MNSWRMQLTCASTWSSQRNGTLIHWSQSKDLFGTFLGPFWDLFGTFLGPFWDPWISDNLGWTHRTQSDTPKKTASSGSSGSEACWRIRESPDGFPPWWSQLLRWDMAMAMREFLAYIIYSSILVYTSIYNYMYIYIYDHLSKIVV